MNRTQNAKAGQVHLLMASWLAVTALCGFGIWGVFRLWRFRMETQLRIDRCVAGVSVELKEVLSSVETSNARMKEIRALLAASTLLPEARAPLQIGLAAFVVHQDAELTRWKLKQASWTVKRGCDSERDLARPLPSLQWIRPSADALGPQPLGWPGGRPELFQVQLTHSPRRAASRVQAQNRKGGSSANWVAQWSVGSGGF